MPDERRAPASGGSSAGVYPGLPCRLPSGLSIRCQNKGEALFVYKEIFEEQVYLRHGITIRDGDCVFDVGANIGMFCVFLQERFTNVVAHAFEPSPDLCNIIRANTAGYGGRVHVHPCGVSDKDGEAQFTFYPNYSILSTFHADDARETDMLRTALRNQYKSAFNDDAGLETRHLDALIGDMLAKKRTIACPLRTLSGVIREQRVEHIDLLKIDAERSELQVLRGILDEDWPRIRQVELEVHDSGGAGLDEVEAVLRRRGFRVTAEAEEHFKDTGVSNVYAVRD